MKSTTTVHHLALVPAAGMAGIALFDAFTKAASGHLSVFSDDSDVRWVQLTGNLVHGLAYVGLVLVLAQHRHVIDATNRTARVTRLLLVGSLGVLAFGFLLVGPFVNPDDLPALASAPIGIAFLLMLLSAPVLGLAVVRRPELRPGSLLLSAMPPILGATLVLGIVAPRFAHPAYLEAALALGIALLGYRAARVDADVVRGPVSAGRRRS